MTMGISKKYKQEGLIGIFKALSRKIPYVSLLWHRHYNGYLKKHYGYVIEKYNNYVPPKNDSPDGLNGVIWTMWYQGEETCPDIVKLCLAAMRKNCGGHKVILITKDNFRKYADIPEYVLKKVSAGHISLTHLSDIVRASLLEKHGGLWIDSTILTTDKIPEEIFEADYYTIKIKNCSNQWASFFWGAKYSKRLLASFMREIFLEYLKNHERLFDYFFLDYTIRTAYREILAFHEECSRVPFNNSNVFKLQDCFLNSEWNAEEFSGLCMNQTFHKLTYKKNFALKTEQGKETFYGHLLSEYGIN